MHPNRYFCCQNPFATLFGDPFSDPAPGRLGVQRGQRLRRHRNPDQTPSASSTLQSDLQNRWRQHVHPRATQYFGTTLSNCLARLEAGLPLEGDPIQKEDRCVIWCGDVGNDGDQACIPDLFNPSNPSDSPGTITYVNRLIPFLFADDEDFDSLMSLPKLPFKMRCNNQLCVNIQHIAFEVVPE